MVGLRPEALELVPSGEMRDDSTVLSGIVTRVAHHGFQSVSYIDVGGAAPKPEREAARPEERRRHLGRGNRPWSLRHRRPDDDVRRTGVNLACELAVRTRPYEGLGRDERVDVQVRHADLAVFDTDGKRIGSGWR